MKGFSLVEVLLVIIILTLITVASFLLLPKAQFAEIEIIAEAINSIQYLSKINAGTDQEKTFLINFNEGSILIYNLNNQRYSLFKKYPLEQYYALKNQCNEIEVYRGIFVCKTNNNTLTNFYISICNKNTEKIYDLYFNQNKFYYKKTNKICSIILDNPEV
ncbi:MAG: prepilin-type N-terminal cleavage/methylation domain-containing protein [Endomicrobia bacterium]|nr:prepilin-type N-terminal cleavage/methylation domain-containing protein [Endomicrobiia bacterium]